MTAMNTQELREQALLPCPFCGGGAAFEHLENSRWSVGCSDIDGDCMGFQSLQTFARKQDAIAAWNTRTPPASVPGWQDIASAPRDETILGLRKYSVGAQPVVCGTLYDLMDGCVIDRWRGTWWLCTHWMPLPTPPTAPTAGEE